MRLDQLRKDKQENGEWELERQQGNCGGKPPWQAILIGTIVERQTKE